MMKHTLIIAALCCFVFSSRAQELSVSSSQYLLQGTSEQLFEEARLQFNERCYPAANATLERLLHRGATGLQEQEAAYLKACMAFYTHAAEALPQLRNYLQTYPDAPNRNRVLALMAMSQYAAGNGAEVVASMYEINPDLLADEERDQLILVYAMALMEQGQNDEALVQLNILEMLSNRYNDEATFYKGFLNYSEKKYAEAAEAFRSVQEEPRFRPQALCFLAETELETGNEVEAEKVAENFLAEFSKNAYATEVKRILGEALYGQQRYAKAALTLEEYLAESDAPQRQALYQLGLAHFHSGEYLRAPEVLAMVTEEEDVMAQNANLHIGLSYLKLGDKNKARLGFEQAANQTADRSLRERAMYNYTVCVHETSYSAFGESMAMFERFLNEFPNSTFADQANSYLVEMYMRTNNYEKALLSIDKIKQPGEAILQAKQKLLYKAGIESFANGDMKKVVEQMNQSLSLRQYDRQTSADACFWRGEAKYRMGQYPQAIADYKQYKVQTLQKGDRTYAMALYGIAYSNFQQNQYNEAFNQFSQFVEQSAASQLGKTVLADAWMRIGDCYFQAKQYANAVHSYERAVDTDPATADYAIFQKGFVQGLMGNYNGKVQTLDMLIGRFPNSDYADDALYEKGRAYVQLDDGNNAIKVFMELTEKYPNSAYAPKAGNEVALIHYQNDRYREAIKAYKAVIINYPGSNQAEVAMRDLKSLYVEQNRVENYVEFASQTQGMVAVDVNEHDSLAYMAAEKSYSRGETEKALEAFNHYLTQFPKGAYQLNAHYYLGCIYYEKDTYELAQLHLQQVAEYKSSKFCEEATRMVADLAFTHKDYTLALVTYRRLVEITGQPETKLHAQLNLMRSAYELNDKDMLVSEGTLLLNNEKLTPETAIEMRYYRAKAYLWKQETDLAKADLTLLAKDTRSVYGAESKYLLAQLYYDNRLLDKAEQEVLDYIKVSTPHSYWLARSFILLSDVYVKKERLVEAKQYLLSLKQNYKGEDSIAEMIEERLEKLNGQNQ